jgi:hypothetical protein
VVLVVGDLKNFFQTFQNKKDKSQERRIETKRREKETAEIIKEINESFAESQNRLRSMK